MFFNLVAGDRGGGGTRTTPWKISKIKGGLKLARVSKKRKEMLEKAHNNRLLEKDRIEEILKLTGKYSNALNPLIDLYLDTHEIYYLKVLEWREEDFKTTKIHTNKSGARNENKHPLAQQVEVWSDKKSRLLGQLGLDLKSQKVAFTGPLASEQNKEPPNKSSKSKEIDENNKLVSFREQMKRRTES